PEPASPAASNGRCRVRPTVAAVRDTPSHRWAFSLRPAVACNGVSFVVPAAGLRPQACHSKEPTMNNATHPVLQAQPLGPLWPTLDPFLFCAHHDDSYPAGDGRMGVQSVEFGGRQMGSDFSRKDGWSMYHGDSVPGFPGHPHRGFETVT